MKHITVVVLWYSKPNEMQMLQIKTTKEKNHSNTCT